MLALSDVLRASHQGMMPVHHVQVEGRVAARIEEGGRLSAFWLARTLTDQSELL
jgi:hypothetical protein